MGKFNCLRVLRMNLLHFEEAKRAVLVSTLGNEKPNQIRD